MTNVAGDLPSAPAVKCILLMRFGGWEVPRDHAFKAPTLRRQ